MLHLRPIFFVVSSLLVILALAMLLPALVDLAVANPDWKVFAVSSGCTLAFAGMLLGRLELFTVLVLFLPSFWKE